MLPDCILANALEESRKAVKKAYYSFVYGGWDAHDRVVANRLSEIREELRRLRDDALDRNRNRKQK